MAKKKKSGGSELADKAIARAKKVLKSKPLPKPKNAPTKKERKARGRG